MSDSSSPNGSRGGLSPQDCRTLHTWASATWRSLEAMQEPSGLLADHLLEGGERASYTSPTNIASGLWSTLAARELGLVDPEEAHRRIRRTLKALGRLERHSPSGAYYNWYSPRRARLLSRWPVTGARLHPFLSLVDNAWLGVALHMVQNAVPALRDQAQDLAHSIDYGFFYDASAGLMRGGFWPAPPAGIPNQAGFTPYYFGALNTETRIASYLAIARGQVSPEHYFKMWRTPAPEDPLPQRAYPGGMWRRFLGVDVFEGHYAYGGVRVVPSWGGSLFEALMPALFVPEARWAPNSWGRNHPLYIYTHIAHGMQEAGYGFWGFAPACRPGHGRHPAYREYGVDAVGIFPNGYTSNDDGVRASPGFQELAGDLAAAFLPPSPAADRQPAASRPGIRRSSRPALTGPAAGSGGSRGQRFRNGVVAPYASFLALEFTPAAAVHNLRSLANNFEVYGEWGFWDSVNVTTGRRAGAVLALDQGLVMASICNALCRSALRDYFADAGIEAALRPLLALEEFTCGADEDV